MYDSRFIGEDSALLNKGHYSKRFALQRQSNFLEGLNLRNKKQIKMTQKDVVSESKKIQIPNISEMTEMELYDLVPGTIHDNKIIYVTTITDYGMMTSLHTIIEDQYGGVVALSVYNLSESAQRGYRKGRKFCIVNPYYSLMMDGLHSLRVDNQNEIIFVEEFPSKQTAKKDFIENILISATDYKIKGNELFKSKQFKEAIENYGIAIKLESSNPIYYSNRSLAYLNIEAIEDAMSDAKIAVELEPNNSKFLFREAAAYSAMENYERSITILESILKTVQSDKETINSALNRNQALLKNQNGQFDFKAMKLLGKSKKYIDIGNYIGPIEIRDAGNKGRGLFVTEDIKKGTTLFVLKAMSSYDIAKQLVTFDFGNTKSGEPTVSRSRPILEMMTQKSQKSKLAALRILSLYNKNNKNCMFAPTSITLYTHRGYELLKDVPYPDYSIDQLRNIVNSNVLYFGENNLDIGLWSIPSFINHGCVYNCIGIIHSNVYILKAITDIPVDEELVFQYDSMFNMLTKEERNSYLKGRNFTCKCSLCQFESRPDKQGLLHKSIDLRNKCRTFSITHPPNKPIMNKLFSTQLKNLVDETVSLAEKLGLGSDTYNAAIWQSFIYLSITPQKEKDFFYVFNNAIRFLYKKEALHQFHFWMNLKIFCYDNLINEPRLFEAEHFLSEFGDIVDSPTFAEMI